MLEKGETWRFVAENLGCCGVKIMPEITLICLKQNKRLKIDETNLHIETWRSLGLTHGYGKGANWETIGCFDGKWYNVRSLKSYLEKDPIWDAYDLVEDEDVEVEKTYLYSYPRDEYDESFIQDLPDDGLYYSVNFVEKTFQNEFLTICEKLIEASSIGTIVVLFRTNAGGTPEKIVGNISPRKFAEMLSNKQVFTSVAYIVKSHKEKYWEYTEVKKSG